jgi:hypothetical protein
MWRHIAVIRTDDVLDTWKQFATRTESFLCFIFGSFSVYPVCTGNSFTANVNLNSHIRLGWRLRINGVPTSTPTYIFKTWCSSTWFFTHKNEIMLVDVAVLFYGCVLLPNDMAKVKQSHYRPRETLTVPACLGSKILRQSAHEGA